MSKHSKADEARKGLVDSVKGKAKEIAGAVTGNDSLTAEGQLEQTQARERKEANAVEAVADAQERAAHEEAARAGRHAAAERSAVRQAAAATESVVHEQRAEQRQVAEETARVQAERDKEAAERSAEREVAQAKAQERRDILDASTDAAEAVDAHREAMHRAAAEQAEADHLERRAEKLTDRADLP